MVISRMRKQKIEALEAAKYLSTFADIHLGVKRKDWHQLPLRDFYEERIGLWCFMDAYALGDLMITDPLAEYVILSTFFELLNEIKINKSDQKALLKNPDFAWLEIRWTTWDKTAIKSQKY